MQRPCPARPPRAGGFAFSPPEGGFTFPSREGGFTFVELMVVLAIMAFAFAYAVVHLDGATSEARLASAGRQMGSTIEFLRGHAIQASRPLEMEIDIDHGTWTSVMPPRPSESEVERRDQEEVLYTEPVLLPTRIAIEAIQLDAHEQKTTGTLVVTFSPLGDITPNGFMIRLLSNDIADREAASFSVEVNGLTGEVSYLPGVAPFDQVVSGDGF